MSDSKGPCREALAIPVLVAHEAVQDEAREEGWEGGEGDQQVGAGGCRVAVGGCHALALGVCGWGDGGGAHSCHLGLCMQEVQSAAEHCVRQGLSMLSGVS